MNSKQSSIFKSSVLMLALGLAFGLSGCGKKENAAPQSKELAQKQEVTINNGTEPESLDPHKTSGVPESNILRQLLEGLTDTDADGHTIPGMAEKWENQDNKVWTFHLRDAKWSNGDPVTADDFVYSLRRVVDPATASPYASYLSDIKVANAKAIADGQAKPETLGVKALDPKTLQITLTEPVPYLPDALLHASTKPVHRKTVEQFGDKWTAPEHFVGNGAYKLKSWAVQDKIVLERNPEYYNNAKTTVQQVTLLPITSLNTDVSRYKAGEIDVTNNSLPLEQFKKLKEELGDEVKTGPNLCVYYYEFNTAKAPFNNPKVRKALSLALDRDTIVNKVLARGETAAYQLTPPYTQGMGEVDVAWKSWDRAKQLAEAKKLLAEAGYDAAHPLSFELLYNTSEAHKTIAVAVTALWKEVFGNVNVSMLNQEWKTYLETRRSGNYQIARGGWCADYNEPSSFLNILKTGNSNNRGKYSNPKFDEAMLATLGSGITDEQRKDLYHKAEIIASEDTPLLLVYDYVNNRLVKPYVQGYSVKNPVDSWQVKYWKILKH